MNINFTTFCRLMLWAVVVAIVMLSAPVGLAILLYNFGVNEWIVIGVSLCSGFPTIFCGFKIISIDKIDNWIWRD